MGDLIECLDECTECFNIREIPLDRLYVDVPGRAKIEHSGMFGLCIFGRL